MIFFTGKFYINIFIFVSLSSICKTSRFSLVNFNYFIKGIKSVYTKIFTYPLSKHKSQAQHHRCCSHRCCRSRNRPSRHRRSSCYPYSQGNEVTTSTDCLRLLVSFDSSCSNCSIPLLHSFDSTYTGFPHL